MPEPTINDMMSAFAEGAVHFAANAFEITLDYSQQSVEQVEVIAGTLYESRPRGLINRLLRRGPSDEEIEKVCKMLGSYIGEVFRRVKGGEWKVHQEFSTLGIEYNGLWFYPLSKVRKRLTNGSEDNLWHYFRVLIEQLAQ